MSKTTSTETNLQCMFIDLAFGVAERGTYANGCKLETDYNNIRSEGASVVEALLSVLFVYDGTTDPESGGDNMVPVTVPDACVPARDALIEAVNVYANLCQEVSAAEAKAGWDPNP